ncbi:MAG: SPOR domain-containing protein [Candidatus Methylopumilus sp.]
MSEENSIQSQEDKLISQAKKRLLGACVILFILLISAPFVLKNRNEEGPTEPIKISMESSPGIVDLNPDSIKPADIKPEIQESPGSQNKKELLPSSTDAKVKQEAIILPNSGLYIQLGIFSDVEKVKPLQQKLNLINIQTKSEVIKINGVDKVRLITDEFKTEALAKDTLLKIKNAGITGIIKKIN